MRVGGVREAEEFVEPLIHRMVVRLVSRARSAVVPLAEQRRYVAALFQHLGDRHLLRRKVKTAVAGDAVVDAVTTGHQRRAGRSADDAGRVKTTEDRALVRDAVEVRRRPFLSAVEADVAVAQVVAEDHDDVRRAVLRRRGRADRQNQHRNRERQSDSHA